jgi:hypothetical protein
MDLSPMWSERTLREEKKADAIQNIEWAKAKIARMQRIVL